MVVARTRGDKATGGDRERRDSTVGVWMWMQMGGYATSSPPGPRELGCRLWRRGALRVERGKEEEEERRLQG